MSTAWSPLDAPPNVPVGPLGLARALVRGTALGLVVYGGLAVLLITRALEAPLFKLRRPVTPYITMAVCRAAFVILGVGYRAEGQPMRHQGAVVANHASWLDIFALNACQRIFFVSKSEVAGWPAIGWLARATGTLFIERDPRRAKNHQALLEKRIRAGHKLLFFPEGTSTDGRRVLPFKSTLFQAFYTHGLEQAMQIQPVSVVYHPPAGADPRLYGWWGAMYFGTHLLKILATRRQGAVEVIFHPPVAVDQFPTRKELARWCEQQVRQGLEARL